MIDGGFSKPYHKVTGIAGYTLTYNSYGLTLTAHEPFKEMGGTALFKTAKILCPTKSPWCTKGALNRTLVGDIRQRARN